MDNIAQLLSQLEAHAKAGHDGHLTILRFTTNWRVGFGTPVDREDLDKLAAGPTLEAAARAALANPKQHVI